ncbi:hypothetical protein H7347_07025 [Corynebacterium sp. zg-331]|nr:MULTISPECIES: hypothetical protein [unclassified Corynebacterium]MBC3186324.1 hypothetical protein [Corynebacterium sp. zg-331]
MKKRRRKIRPSSAQNIDRRADTPHREFFERRSEEFFRQQRPPHHYAR